MPDGDSSISMVPFEPPQHACMDAREQFVSDTRCPSSSPRTKANFPFAKTLYYAQIKEETTPKQSP